MTTGLSNPPTKRPPQQIEPNRWARRFRLATAINIRAATVRSGPRTHPECRLRNSSQRPVPLQFRPEIQALLGVAAPPVLGAAARA